MFKRKATLSFIASAVAVLSLALAACSSSSSGSADGGASPAASGSSGTPILIGSICSCTGSNASIGGSAPKVVDAWVASVNAAGGINGHPVKVHLIDDSSDPAKALRAAKTLVEQDHVMAIGGEISNFDASFQTYIEGTGVPIVGGEAFNPPMTTSADFFPSGGDLAAANYGLASEAKKAGKTKFALMVCAEAPICGLAIKPFGRLLSDLIGGMSLAYSTKITATAPNYTAECLAAKQAGADAMFVEQFPSVVPRVVDGCAQQNYKPAAFNIAAGGTAGQVLADPNWKGATVIEYNLPITNTTTPGAAAFHDALTKYAPGLQGSSGYNDSLMGIWAGLELFRAAAKQQKLGPDSTSSDVKKGLYGLKDETLDGLAPPLNYVEGKPTTISCWFVEKVQDGKLTDPYNGEPQCVPPNEVAQLNALYGN